MIVQIHGFVLGYKGTKESNKEEGLVLLNYRLILVSAQYVSILHGYFKVKLNNYYKYKRIDLIYPLETQYLNYKIINNNTLA
jgi:hypothetical protein